MHRHADMECLKVKWNCFQSHVLISILSMAMVVIWICGGGLTLTLDVSHPPDGRQGSQSS